MRHVSVLAPPGVNGLIEDEEEEEEEKESGMRREDAMKGARHSPKFRGKDDQEGNRNPEATGEYHRGMKDAAIKEKPADTGQRRGRREGLARSANWSD